MYVSSKRLCREDCVKDQQNRERIGKGSIVMCRSSVEEERAKHEFYMKLALAEARKAEQKGEIPVGALVVYAGEIVGRGHNLRETTYDPAGHAEIIALREAGAKVGSWRLPGAVIYVTLEPCPMCAGAIVQARLERLVYGADDLKAGSAGTLLNLLQFPGLNHSVKITGGILAEEAGLLLQEFFQECRLRKS